MIKDSGSRREFVSGAVRDIADGKGRCDLLPLDIVGLMLHDEILNLINSYLRGGNILYIYHAIHKFSQLHYEGIYSALLETSKQYEDGAKKYSDRNWEKGIPLHCYVDSGVRHYLKFLRGDTDEPHDRAFIWNMLGLAWTSLHKPELNDLPFGKESK